MLLYVLVCNAPVKSNQGLGEFSFFYGYNISELHKKYEAIIYYWKLFTTVLINLLCDKKELPTDHGIGGSPQKSVSRKSSFHRVRRIATTTFWCTFHFDGKIIPACWGWGVHALSLSLYLPSRAKLQCRSSWEQIQSPYFYSTPICTLCCKNSQNSLYPVTPFSNIYTGKNCS